MSGNDGFIAICKDDWWNMTLEKFLKFEQYGERVCGYPTETAGNV